MSPAFRQRNLVWLVSILATAACDRPTAVGRPVTVSPSVPNIRVPSAEFRTAAAWPWNGPTHCADLTGVPGVWDPAMAYMINMITPAPERLTSAVRLEFDSQRRLILFQEDRDYAWYPGERRPSHTHISIETGLGKLHWMRIGNAVNYRYRGAGRYEERDSKPGQLVKEHLTGTAEEIWHHPALGVQDLYRLAIEKCGEGQRFTTTFEDAAGHR